MSALGLFNGSEQIFALTLMPIVTSVEPEATMYSKDEVKEVEGFGTSYSSAVSPWTRIGQSQPVNPQVSVRAEFNPSLARSGSSSNHSHSQQPRVWPTGPSLNSAFARSRD